MPRYGTPSGAVLGEGRLRRLRLWRCWNRDRPRCGWVCLNPSTADETENDQSVRKMVGFAALWGYGAVDVVNLFDWRCTDPEELYEFNLRLSSAANDRAILAVAREAEIVVCAWGNHGRLQGRGVAVRELLMRAGLGGRLRALRINRGGSPAHPLMLPYNLRPAKF